MCIGPRHKRKFENWILSLDNVSMFLQKNQLNISFSNVLTFSAGIVFFRTHCTLVMSIRARNRIKLGLGRSDRPF